MNMAEEFARLTDEYNAAWKVFLDSDKNDANVEIFLTMLKRVSDFYETHSRKNSRHIF